MIDITDLNIQQKLADYLKRERLEKINNQCEVFEFKDTIYSKYIKRLIDILIAFPAFVITLPINAVLGLLTFFILGNPIFFKQERIGKNGVPFKLVKFRNMTDECDENGELLPAQKRLTKFGMFVRKTSLDELLNFWSVLKGDMSIIGPRALPRIYYERYNTRHALRLKVKPGLECPPRSLNANERSWHEQFENDCWYVQNISFKTDCYLAIQLIRFTIDKKNAKMRAQCKKGSFIGYGLDGKAISNYDLDMEYIRNIIDKTNSSGMAL